MSAAAQRGEKKPDARHDHPGTNLILIREALPTPAIVLVLQPDLPLTPVAEHFCDV